MRVAVINIPSKVGPDAWERCWEKAAGLAPVFGVNEAFLGDAKALYLRLAKQHGYSQYGTRLGPNPVFWERDRFRRVSGKVRKIHDRGSSARARRYPGFNDARYITDLVLKPRGQKDAREFAVLNTHWTPEGSFKVPKDWFEETRRESFELTRELVREHTDAGRVVYFMGDTNTAREFVVTKNFHWVRGKGIDKIGVGIPRGLVLDSSRFRLFDAPTDHDHGVLGVVRLRKA